MKKYITLLLSALVTLGGWAEDIIVMRSGDLISAIVLEIGTNEIKYKKVSNPNGPTYTLAKAEVLSIKYENGDTDKFEEQSAPTQGVRQEASFDEEINKDYIRRISPENVKYIGTPSDKAAEQIVLLYAPAEGSVLADKNIEVLVSSTGNVTTFNAPSVNITLKNKSNQTLYVDLGNCFFVCDGVATQYYVPSVTSTTKSTTGGVGVNLGAVAGAMGVGGTLGTLASGVNVGGTKGASTTTTTFAERVLRLPPMSTYTLEGAVMNKPQSTKLSGLDYGTAGTYQRLTYQRSKDKLLKEGEEYYDFDKSIFPQMSTIITYSHDESISEPIVLTASFEPYKMIAAKIGKALDLRFLNDTDYTANLRTAFFISLTQRKKK